MTETKVGTWEWTFFTLEPCAAVSLLGLEVGTSEFRIDSLAFLDTLQETIWKKQQPK